MFIKNKHSCPKGHLCLFLINHSISVFIYYIKIGGQHLNPVSGTIIQQFLCRLDTDLRDYVIIKWNKCPIF